MLSHGGSRPKVAEPSASDNGSNGHGKGNGNAHLDEAWFEFDGLGRISDRIAVRFCLEIGLHEDV